MVQPFAASQAIEPLGPEFGRAFKAVQIAELAGARPSEVSQLVANLNKALELNRQAVKLNVPGESEKRHELLAQVDQILTTVQADGSELAVSSAQRSYNDRVLTYLWAAIAAILGTLIYGLTASFYQKYRIKRTMQMRISHK